MKPVIYTYTGRRVNPLALALAPADVDLRDLAHGLALCNRFAGHTREPVSVAQHSVYASHLVPPDLALQALLHDGAEAYLGDVTKWVKQSPLMAAYRAAEHAAQEVIYTRFGCPTTTHPLVEAADRLLVRYEGVKGFGAGWIVGDMNPAAAGYYPPLTPEEVAAVDGLFDGWRFWGWREAERAFLERFNALTAGGLQRPRADG